MNKRQRSQLTMSNTTSVDFEHVRCGIQSLCNSLILDGTRLGKGNRTRKSSVDSRLEVLPVGNEWQPENALECAGSLLASENRLLKTGGSPLRDPAVGSDGADAEVQIAMQRRCLLNRHSWASD